MERRIRIGKPVRHHTLVDGTLSMVGSLEFEVDNSELRHSHALITIKLRSIGMFENMGGGITLYLYHETPFGWGTSVISEAISPSGIGGEYGPKGIIVPLQQPGRFKVTLSSSLLDQFTANIAVETFGQEVAE